MEQKRSEGMRKYVPESLSFLVLAIGILLSLFAVYEKTALRQEIAARIASRREARLALYQNPAIIESWMTFDYIDHVFHLPPQYLKSALSINSSRYPIITLGTYAKSAKLPQSGFLDSVRAAVGSYKK